MQINLSSEQFETIKKLVSEIRKDLGVYIDVPVADDLRSLLEKKNITVCEQVFSKNIDAAITIFEANGEKMTFIGLNSTLHYDEQLFALAHELYHYMTKTGMAFKPELDDNTECMADRFAAELLLPSDALHYSVNGENLNSVSTAKLWRIIAKLQCKWWLPYKAIVKRLLEENYISQAKFDELYNAACRDPNNGYGKIFYNLDKEKFVLLNSVTNANSISNNIIEITIQNFEEDLISEDEFTNTLALFGKQPSDFGFNIQVDNDDDELAEFFGGNITNEG